MQRLNRWLGIFLTFVLTMSVLCLNVWATDPAENVEDQTLAVAAANELYVNCDYNSSTEGWGVTHFSNYAGAYAYATANGKTNATIIVEKTNTLSGNCFDNDHKNYSRLAVVIKDGAIMGNAASKWDMTYPVTVEPGGTLTCARGKNSSISNVHIKNTLTVGAEDATKKAVVDFLSDTYQDCDISIRYNGKILLNNADFRVQDLDAQGALTIANSDVYVDGAFSSATFYATTLTDSTMTVKGIQISGGLSDFAGGTSNQLGNVKITNSELTIQEGSTKVVANVTATGSDITVNNLTVNTGKTVNLNDGSSLETTGNAPVLAGTAKIKVDGNEAVIDGNGSVVVPVAKIGDVKYTSLEEALNAAAAGTGNVTVEILADINLTGIDWAPVTVSAPGYPMVTVNGNGKTITGLNDMLFAGTWAGGSGLIINDLTIKDSTIVNDENDAAGNIGVGAFIGFPQASATITLDNCHLVDSTVKGGHWTGGLIGYAAGYAGNDGPVFMNLTIKDCSVTGSTITGKGSAGGIIGHATGNAWTNVAIETTTVSGNTVTSTGSSTNKAGAVVGTIGAAGQPTTVNGVEKTGGVAVSATVSGNTVKSSGTTITTVYGRQGTDTGMLEIAGGSYDSNPIEENVSYAAPAEGYMIVEKTDGSFGLAADPAYGKVAKIGDTYYETLAEAIEAAKSGDEIVLIADVAENATLPAGITLNGNGKFIDGEVFASGDLTFVGYTKIKTFNAGYNKPIITIGAGATLETTTGRMVIGHGATFNITGTFTDAKTANTADLTPSLIAPGASFTGAGVNFNVTNAYIKFTAYCSSKNNNASSTFNIAVTNSIWEQSGSLVFSEPTSGKDPTFKLNLKDSVLNSTSHLVFAVTKGEIVFDNSNVNVGVYRQLENRSTLTIKNGSVVYAAHATSSNAKNPGTTIVENATYVATGDFSGSDVGTGTLVVKSGANVTMGKITGANIQIDATGMAAGDVIDLTADLSTMTGTVEVINNNALEAQIVDGKIVLAEKPVAMIGDVKYATLAEAIAAVKANGGTLTLLANAYESMTFNYPADGAPVEITIDLNGFTVTSAESTLWVSDGYVVTVKDSVGTGKIVTTSNNGSDSAEAIAVNRDGKVILEGGTVEAPYYGVFLYSGNTIGKEVFVMNGGKIEVPNGGQALSIGKGKATINGGEVIINKVPGGAGWNTVVYENGVLNITGGEFFGTVGNWGTISISGGTFAYPDDPNDGFYNEHLADGYSTKVNADGSITVYALPTSLQGSGTEEDPYLINNIDDLKFFRDSVNNGTRYNGQFVKLNADIDLNDEEWTPIGDRNVDQGSFLGTFDGGDHTISNLWISQWNKTGAGFFSKVGMQTEYVSGTVKNLTFENVTIISSQSYVGVIAQAPSGALIDKVHVTGDINISGYGYVGGIVGHGYPTINNSSVIGNGNGTITANYWGVGAILGFSGDYGSHVNNATVEGVKIHSEQGGAASVTGSPYGAAINGANVKNVVITSNSDYCMGYVSAGGSVANVTATNVTATASGQPITPADVVATIGSNIYFSLEEAIDDANAGETINLLADIEATEVILIDKSITINGNEHKVTSSATRVFRVTTNNVEVTLKNVNIVSTAVRVGTNDIRGISIDIVDNVKLTLNNCSVDFTDASANDWAYAVNVTGGNNHTVTIDGGAYEGANVINVRGANNTIVVKDATLTCTYPNNDVYYGACIWVLQNQGSNVQATGNTFNGTNAVAFNLGTGTTLTESNNADNTKKVVAKIGDTYYTTLADAIAAIGSGDVVIELLADATLNYGAREAFGAADTTSVTINGNGKTLTLNQTNSDWSSFGLASDAKLVLNNMTIEKTGYGDTSGAWNTHAIIFSCNVEMNNVTVNNSVAVQNGATLNNVTINEANGYYGLWINGNGQTVTMNGGEINATNGGRGIKIADQYISAPASVNLTVDGTKFNTAKKAAVLVSSTAGANITASNVDVTNVAADSTNFVHVDEDWGAYNSNVTVTGATKAQEAVETFVATVGGNYYKTLAEALEAAKGEKDIVIELVSDATLDITAWQTLAIGGDTTETITINGNGKTLTFNKLNSDWNNIATNNDAKLILNNMTITDSGKNNGPWNRYDLNFACDVELNNVKATKALAFKADATLNNVEINETGDNYAIWIQPNGQKVAIDGLTVTSAGRGIKIDQQYVDAPAKVELTVKNATFTTEKKAAILVKSTAGAEITLDNVDISNVKADTVNAVWNDSDAGANYSKITVTGGTLAQEAVETFVATVGGNYYKTLADALAAAKDGETIKLIWADGDAPIAMNGAVYGKTVTITGTATVDWSKGFLFIGRGGVGNGTVIFKDAVLTSASDNASTGIHVSGREKDAADKYDGTLVINNSTIELDYLINKGTMTLDYSTLTVKNGFSIGGRPASETESGEDATATITLKNGSKVVVNKHNGMGLGYEAIGVMNIDATSTFETTQSFLVTAKGTMNIAGKAVIAGTLTNNGQIVLTDAAATLTSSECGNVTTNVADHKVAYANGTYSVVKNENKIISYSLSLEGEIAYRVTYQLKADTFADENAKIVFSFVRDGEPVVVEIPVNNGVSKGDNEYQYSVDLYSYEMTTQVTSKLVIGEEEQSNCTGTASIRQYAKFVINSNDPVYTEDLKELVKAMLNYGAYAQVQFGYNTDNLANADYETNLSEVDASEIVNINKAEGSVEGISIRGVSLELESQTTLRFTFVVTGDIADYTFKCGDIVLEPTKLGEGVYRVSIENINVYELDKAYTVVVNDTYKVTSSALSYASIVANGDYNDALKNLAKAMYLYNEAGNTYFSAN